MRGDLALAVGTGLHMRQSGGRHQSHLIIGDRGKERPVLLAAHGRSSVRRVNSICLARYMRDITVPIGIPSLLATSA